MPDAFWMKRSGDSWAGRRRVPLAALDSSGFDCGHASRYYVNRRAKGQAKDEKTHRKTRSTKRFAKLEVVVDCQTHLILAAIPGPPGPRSPTATGSCRSWTPPWNRVRIVTALGDGRIRLRAEPCVCPAEKRGRSVGDPGHDRPADRETPDGKSTGG